MFRVFIATSFFCFGLLAFCLGQEAGMSEHEKHFVAGEKLRKAGKVVEAIDAYNMAIKLAPEDYRYYYQKGKCSLAARQEDNALRCFEKTAALKDDFVPAHENLAKIYLKRKQIPGAIKHFDACQKFEKDYDKKMDYILNIIRLLFKLEMFDAAQKYIAEGKKISPQNINLLYYIARYYNMKGDYNAAIASMVDATQKLYSAEPKVQAKFYYELGYAYNKTGQYPKATEAFKKANYGSFRDKVAAMSPNYYYSLALAHFNIYNFAESKKYVGEALKMKPDYPEAYQLLAKIETSIQRKDPIIENVKKAVEVERDPLRRANLYYELCFLEFNSARYDDAIKSGNRALEGHASNYLIKYMQAAAHHKKGENAQAATILEGLSKLGSLDYDTKAQFNFLLGLVYKDLGQEAKAQEALKRASYGAYKYAANHEAGQAEDEDEGGMAGDTD